MGLKATWIVLVFVGYSLFVSGLVNMDPYGYLDFHGRTFGLFNFNPIRVSRSEFKQLSTTVAVLDSRINNMKRLIVEASENQSKSLKPSCPKEATDAKFFRNACYSYEATKVMFGLAQDRCHDKGGILVEMKYYNYKYIVENLQQAFSQENVQLSWMGLTRGGTVNETSRNLFTYLESGIQVNLTGPQYLMVQNLTNLILNNTDPYGVTIDLQNKLWTVESAKEPHPYICQYSYYLLA